MGLVQFLQFNRAKLFAGVLTGLLTACGDMGEYQEGPRNPKPGEEPNPSAQPPPPAEETQDPPIPLTSALQINGVEGFGLGQKASNGFAAFGLMAANETVLVSLKSDGEVEEILLPETPDYDPDEDETPQLKQVLQIVSAGVILQFNDFRYFCHTNATWIKSDGTIRPFAPEGFTATTQFFFKKNLRSISTARCGFLEATHSTLSTPARRRFHASQTPT